MNLIEVKPANTEALASRDGDLATDQAAQKGRSLYYNVIKQFNKAADLMRLDLNIQRILEKTATEIIVHFPVKMDDGRIEMLTGYRVQHNNALGPFKGGLRYTRVRQRRLVGGATYEAARREVDCG